MEFTFRAFAASHASLRGTLRARMQGGFYRVCHGILTAVFAGLCGAAQHAHALDLRPIDASQWSEALAAHLGSRGRNQLCRLFAAPNLPPAGENVGPI